MAKIWLSLSRHCQWHLVSIGIPNKRGDGAWEWTFQHCKGCLIIRWCQVSDPRDWVYECSHRCAISQVARQQGCRDACQISERLYNSLNWWVWNSRFYDMMSYGIHLNILLVQLIEYGECLSYQSMVINKHSKISCQNISIVSQSIIRR